MPGNLPASGVAVHEDIAGRKMCVRDGCALGDREQSESWRSSADDTAFRTCVGLMNDRMPSTIRKRRRRSALPAQSMTVLPGCAGPLLGHDSGGKPRAPIISQRCRFGGLLSRKNEIEHYARPQPNVGLAPAFSPGERIHQNEISRFEPLNLAKSLLSASAIRVRASNQPH
jgi:hypothetical protein